MEGQITPIIFEDELQKETSLNDADCEQNNNVVIKYNLNTTPDNNVNTKVYANMSSSSKPTKTAEEKMDTSGNGESTSKSSASSSSSHSKTGARPKRKETKSRSTTDQERGKPNQSSAAIILSNPQPAVQQYSQK